MKFLAIVVLATFITCSYADLRDELLARATVIAGKVKNETAALIADDKTDLAARISAEEATLEKIVADLKAATGEEAIRLLDQELLLLEIRFTSELRLVQRIIRRYAWLEREAERLRVDVAAERARLALVTGIWQAQARQISAALAIQEEIILELAGALKFAQSESRLVILEDQLANIERLVIRELEMLGFDESMLSSTARSSVAPSSTARSSAAASSTARSSVAYE